MNPNPRQAFFFPRQGPVLEVRTTLDSALPYAEHFHSSFSFGFILAGGTRFFLGKEAYLAQAGDIVLIDPEQVHSCNPIDGGLRSYHMAHLDAEWFHRRLGDGLYGQDDLQQDGLRVVVPLVRDSELSAQARALLEATCSDSAVSEQAWMELLVTLHTRHHCFAPQAHHVQSWKQSALALAEDDITEQIMQGDYSISALARAAGVRRESFSRSVQKVTGLPPSSYLHCLRLEHGRHMLQEGCSIAEAASAAGYVDQSHFHRMFVKYCSVTPGRYRKNKSHPYKK